MPHICVSELGQRWFRLWLVVYSAPSHYLNQFWSIVNWTIGNKFQWNFNQNTKFFIHENASENIVCETVAMLSRGRWAKSGHWCADAISRLSSVLVVIFPTLCLFTKFVGSTPITFPVNMIQMFRNDINSMSLMSKFLVVIIHPGGVCVTVWCQTIIWSSVGLLLIGPWEKNSVIFWLNYNFQTRQNISKYRLQNHGQLAPASICFDNMPLLPLLYLFVTISHADITGGNLSAL